MMLVNDPAKQLESRDGQPCFLQVPSVHQAFPIFKREDLCRLLTEEELSLVQKEIIHNIPLERYR
jgi:hypothetical protein